MSTAARARSPALRLTVLAAVLVLLLLVTFLAGAYLEGLTTVVYADTRTMLGVPNALNVLSNLAFLAVGIAGLSLGAATLPAQSAAAWRLFYLGMVATACGSGFFHWSPSLDTLVWDRLGMVVAFVGLLAAVLAESVPVVVKPAPLAAGVLVGVASVLWWRQSGDLRPYAWVQLTPLAIVTTTLLARWLPAALRAAMLMSLAAYVLAKLAETFDARLYELTGHLLSGHTLKHLLAAAAGAVIYTALRRRASIPN